MRLSVFLADFLLTAYVFSMYYCKRNSIKGDTMMKLSKYHHQQKKEISIQNTIGKDRRR